MDNRCILTNPCDPGSFVVTADGNTSFAEAVRRKLVLEIAGDLPSAAADGEG